MNDAKQYILSKFPSLTVVAKICGVTPGAVSQWKIIPAKHQLSLLSGAKEYGVKLKPNDFYSLPKKEDGDGK